MRLRAMLVPGVGYSQVTLFQSHSSSSATIWARPVSEPWPISECAMRTTTVSSRRITTQAVISGEPLAAGTMAMPPNGLTPIASPPPTAALVRMNERREILGALIMVLPSCLGSHVNGLTHLLQGAAAADIGDRTVDFGIGRLRLFAEERGDRHDHARLAIAALRHVVIEPGPLHLVQDIA